MANLNSRKSSYVIDHTRTSGSKLEDLRPKTERYANNKANGNNVVDVEIINQSPGNILNIYQTLILDSKWDVRESCDFSSIIIARDHMFYNTYNNEYNGEKNIKGRNDKIRVDNEKLMPVSFFSYACSKLIKEGNTDNFDQGTMYYYTGLKHKNKRFNINNPAELKENEKFEEAKEASQKTMFEKNLYRDGSRRFSENWFAISGFNLIMHNISVNYDVPNTASEIKGKSKNSKDNKKITISILGEISDKNLIIEKIYEPPIPSSSINESKDNKFRCQEFLANALLQDLKYVYQGTIMIKFNAGVEIGDKITLIDKVSSTFGVFEIDSFEHVLDDVRGLMTILFVKSSWEFKDPVLDFHAQDIGYKLADSLKASNDLDSYPADKFYNVSTKKESLNLSLDILAIYLKNLVKSPKYCLFYVKKKEGFFSKTTIEDENRQCPAGVPLRFYPMMVKGVPQIPDNIKRAFAHAGAINGNGIKDLLNSISISAEDIFVNFLSGLKTVTKTVLLFLGDMFLSTVTFDLHELLKASFGLTESKALKATYGKVDDLFYKRKYNPYNEEFKLNTSPLDYVIGFFNVRLKDKEDFYTGNKKNINYKDALLTKTEVVKQMFDDIFDCMCLVELYDSFNIEELEGYDYKDFVSSVAGEHDSQIFEITENNYYNGDQKMKSKEYGAVISKKSFSILKEKPTSSPILNNNPIDNRNCISFKLEFKEKINGIKSIIVVFFHNIYGESMYDSQNNPKDPVKFRKKNIEVLMEKFSKEVNEETGVVIMGDFNIVIFNQGKFALNTSHSISHSQSSISQNNIYILPEPKEIQDFVSKISNTPTTLNMSGELTGNLFDNVLISKNLDGKVTAGVFDYNKLNIENRRMISDHIPIYLGIKRI